MIDLLNTVALYWSFYFSQDHTSVMDREQLSLALMGWLDGKAEKWR